MVLEHPLRHMAEAALQLLQAEGGQGGLFEGLGLLQAEQRSGNILSRQRANIYKDQPVRFK